MVRPNSSNRAVNGNKMANKGPQAQNFNNVAQVPSISNGSEVVEIDNKLWPLFNDLLIIAGNEGKCNGSLTLDIVEDLTFVVRSLCRRVANQQLKEKCISLVGGSNEPHSAPIMVSCGPEHFNKPGDVYTTATLTLQEFNWTFVVEAKNANECLSYIVCEPCRSNTVWSATAKFSFMVNGINFESGDVDFTFDNPRVAVPWLNSPQPGLLPRGQMRNPLKVTVNKVGVRVLPIPDFVTVSPDDANTSIYIEGKPVPVNFQLLSYHCPALRSLSIVDGKTQLHGFALGPFRSFLDNLINNAPVNANNVANLLDVSSNLQCVLVRERCEQFLIQTTELPFPVKLDLATRYKLAIAQAYCLAVIRNHKEVEEARSDPEFDKMSELAKQAFAIKEKSLGPKIPPVVKSATPVSNPSIPSLMSTIPGNNGGSAPRVPGTKGVGTPLAVGASGMRGSGGPTPMVTGPIGGPGMRGGLSMGLGAPGLMRGPGLMGMRGPGLMGPMRGLGPMGPRGMTGLMRPGPNSGFPPKNSKGGAAGSVQKKKGAGGRALKI